MSALSKELAFAQDPVLNDPAVARWLAERMGVNLAAFTNPPNIGVARINPAQDGTYTPAPDGPVRALILPAQVPTSRDNFEAYLAEFEDQGGDLVAVDVADPARWWTRNGSAVALNSIALEQAADDGLPARLFGHPMEWVWAAGASGRLDWRVGAVVLDWSRAAQALAGIRVVECAPHLAGFVASALRTMPNPPRLLVDEVAA